MKLLKNRTAFVTGENRGIGAGVARAFAEQGTAIAIEADVTDAAAVEAKIYTTISSLGRN